MCPFGMTQRAPCALFLNAPLPLFQAAGNPSTYINAYQKLARANWNNSFTFNENTSYCLLTFLILQEFCSSVNQKTFSKILAGNHLATYAIYFLGVALSAAIFFLWCGFFPPPGRCNGQFFPPASLSPGKDQAGPFLPRGRNWLVIFSPGEKNNQSVFSPPGQFFPHLKFFNISYI